MENILVFDTETTGKIVDWKASLHEMPFLVQVAAVLFTPDARPVAHMSFMTFPEYKGQQYPIPAEAAGVHGVTQELLDEVGYSTKLALAVFNNMLKRAGVLVAHNMSFDDKIIRAAYMRIAADQDVYKAIKKGCTKNMTTNHLKLPGKYGKFKWPSLDEAYRAMVNPDGFSGAHDAMVDVLACADVFFAARKVGLPIKGM
jgi:DNA polymerase III epsilon subunit-like protein